MITPVDQPHKRTLEIPSKPTKRIKKNPRTSQKIATLVTCGEIKDALRNTVWMNKTQCVPFIQIGSRIYSVTAKNIIEKDSLGVSPLQFNELICEDVVNAKHETVTFTPFNPEPNPLQQITVKLKGYKPTLDRDQLNPELIELEELRKRFQSCFLNKPFTNNQTYLLELPENIFRMEVLKLTGLAENRFYGILTEDTKIDFVLPDELVVIDQVIQEKNSRFHFALKLHRLHNVNIPKPYLIDYKSFSRLLFDTLENKLLLLGQKTLLTLDDYIVEAELQDVDYKDLSLPPLSARPYDHGFKLHAESTIHLTASRSFLLTDGPSLPIQAIHFELQEFMPIPTLDKGVPNSCLDSRTIVDAIKKCAHFVLKQKMNIYLAQGWLTVCAKEITGQEAFIPFRETEWEKRWALTKNSTIHLKPLNSLKAKLLDTKDPKPLKEIIFKTSSKTDRRVILPPAFLEEQLRQLMKSPFHPNKTFDFLVHGEHKVSFTIHKETFETPPQWAYNGFITPATKFSFISDTCRVKFDAVPAPQVVDRDLLLEFEEAGVGGLKSKIEKILRKALVVCNPKTKTIAFKSGTDSVEGILLHGPEGTGKTALVKALASVLEIPEERQTLLSGLDRTVDHFTAVENFFLKARKEYEKKKEMSDPYLIVVDDMQDHSERTIQHLISEMARSPACKNILVFGLTNRASLLDHALLRAGRFGFHVEIPLPEVQDRKTIFAIHTKKLAQEQRLGPDVDLMHLAHETAKRSGADIKQVVDIASSYALARLQRLAANNDFASRKEGIVTRHDFERAIEELKAIPRFAHYN